MVPIIIIEVLSKAQTSIGMSDDGGIYLGMELTVDVGAVFTKTKRVLLAPKRFFQKNRKERGWKKAFVFVLVVAGVGHILTGAYNVALFPSLSTTVAEALDVPVDEINSGKIILATMVSFILSLGMSFVWGAALKVWLSLFKIASSFPRAYRVMVYSRTPNFLLSWFPVVNLAAALYSFYLLMVGLEEEYSIPRGKALVVVVSSAVILSVLSFFVFSLMAGGE